ncbi:MAG: methyltransferase domain-containing protein [Sphingobacteriales bacterium]
MANKHYNINYLEETGRFLKNLKEYSYQPFTRIISGAIIDLGCGTGADVSNLGKLLGEQVMVTGIDHDETMLKKAESSFNDQKNIQFILSEANTIPFENETVSGLRAERLIQHLAAPESTVFEMHRVLKKGHPLVLVETDWPSLTFYNEHLAIENKIIQYLTDKKINNGLAARKLSAYMECSGFENIHIEIFPFIIKSLKEANEYLWIERMISEASDENFISTQERDVFLPALHQSDEKNCFACTINVVIASSTK